MSGADTDDLRDPDATAGEFVLGVLDAAEQAEVARAAAADPALQAAIAAWERRLAPLARLVDPVAPPAALWERLAGSIAAAPAAGEVVTFARPVAIDRRLVRRWQAATAVSLALAASLAVVAALPVLRRPPSAAPAPGLLVASLATYGQPAAGFVAAVDHGTLTVRPAAAATVPAGRDLELWSLPPGAKAPAPLGVLPAGGVRLTGSPATTPGTQILISLEPRGGSPTGQPTGPVLFAGRLARLY